MFPKLYHHHHIIKENNRNYWEKPKALFASLKGKAWEKRNK